MSVSNDSTVSATIDAGRASLSSPFLKFCTKVRNNDPSILPEPSLPLQIRHMSEKEHIEFADALLENTNVTYLELRIVAYTKGSAEAMAKYLRSSKHLQRIQWTEASNGDDRAFLRHYEEMLCCFLAAIQKSTSIKQLYMELPRRGGPSKLAFENMLTHTKSLRSLSLIFPCVLPEDWAIAAASSGLKKNTTLRELTLIVPPDAMTASPILTSLCDHPSLRKLCLRGHVVDLIGLETLLLSGTSKFTELEIHWYDESLELIFQALARRPTLTKLELRYCPLDRDDARQLEMILCGTPSLQSLVLIHGTLGNAELGELAPALNHNKSIKVLDISENLFNDMASAEILRDILRSNKTMTALDLSGNQLGETTGAVECIADGLGGNSTLLKIDLSRCNLGDGSLSSLAQTLGSRNTTLQKLAVGGNAIASTGVGVLVEMMEQSHNITDLDLQRNCVGDEGAIRLARSLGNCALPALTSLSLSRCRIGEDGFIALVSALEQNTSLLRLDLRYNYAFSEPVSEQRAFLALADSLPKIKVLQQLDLSTNERASLVLTAPLLLAGLRQNTSLFRFHVARCAPQALPPALIDRKKCPDGWVQELKRLGYRNRFLPMIRAPKEMPPPLGAWPHALARVATLPDVIYEVLHSKPSLVPSEDTNGKEAASSDTRVPKKRMRGD
jgi:Ran GTPase-activating protein (RanGAP) involved in mRNA processing and transport